jgi:hypothetical protein
VNAHYPRFVTAGRAALAGPSAGVSVATVADQEQGSSAPKVVLRHVLGQIDKPAKLKNVLSERLQAALHTIARDIPSTVEQMEAFVQDVEEMRGRSLSDAETDRLIRSSRVIIDALNASNGSRRASRRSTDIRAPSGQVSRR